MKKAAEMKTTHFRSPALCVSFSNQSEYIRMAFCGLQDGEKEMRLGANSEKGKHVSSATAAL